MTGKTSLLMFPIYGCGAIIRPLSGKLSAVPLFVRGCRIEEFEEKPMVSSYNTISTGIYVIRRRQLIELIERAALEGRHDFVKDILIRYKNLKRIYGYKIDTYWSNISTAEA